MENLRPIEPYPFLDFFAGSGLIAEGMRPYFSTVWANDNSAKKAKVYRANQTSGLFHLGPIEAVSGRKVPPAVLSWASFPCVDLSLAGKLAGLKGRRSGLVWEWLRVMDEMESPPPLLVIENVVGLVSARGGVHYRNLHSALLDRGYVVGPMILDAVEWLPQSRPRVFVVAVQGSADAIRKFTSPIPCRDHPKAVQRAADGLPHLKWWVLPRPSQPRPRLEDLIQSDAPSDPEDVSRRNLALIPEAHRRKLEKALSLGVRAVPGYRRTRGGKQVLELRTDGSAGCLRTPQGGSSRQHLVLRRENGELATRVLTSREAARLMGAPDTYVLPENYSEGYAAMGDAVAVPVIAHLAKHLLFPLAVEVTNETRARRAVQTHALMPVFEPVPDRSASPARAPE